MHDDSTIATNGDKQRPKGYIRWSSSREEGYMVLPRLVGSRDIDPPIVKDRLFVFVLARLLREKDLSNL